MAKGKAVDLFLSYLWKERSKIVNGNIKLRKFCFVCFWFVCLSWSHWVDQAGPEFLDPNDPPASAFQVTGTTDVCHCAQQGRFFSYFAFRYEKLEDILNAKRKDLMAEIWGLTENNKWNGTQSIGRETLVWLRRERNVILGQIN